ncbi:putative acyl-CoA dehydrogenase [Gordonia polyisoprenivorans NBRC 16320 = JCM 10675]|uniref:Acyl-CoA dehydrogenase n=1 Tax=Gordonia polyisoprenivorans TaxID=84595 RepID=A0A846WS87_9ACTN|nr:acyl-CoA dehydrogenase family protein [Gordonia polyisoprenivorans]NKY04432.1 acyl-CoA dehydrogenase [Gordonia polyisoprenivorans]WCB38934.1 acyl-CoA dehydrogenase family protein [Gordonia polyisoprenivorans]GAB25456.1 putative acyl-CoA dehydrogenase [Gordonia polyisoprenivorans NBRC 16320 = JCM 10675]
MHWELSDEQELFASSLREWLAAKFPTDTVRELVDAGDTAGFAEALVGEGWWGVGYAEDVDGQGGGILELALAAREFGRAAVPDSRWLAAALSAPLLSVEELAAQVAGEKLFVVAVRADRAPGDGGRTLRLSADGSTVTGSVSHVLAASDADVFLVPVQRPEGLAIARVPADGATTHAEHLLDRSRSAATVDFDAAPVSAVSSDGSSLQQVGRRAAVLIAADALGSAERMLELAVEYSKQRKQFGQFIGSFQAVKHAAAQMLVTVESAYSIALYAAAAADAELADADTIAAVAKAQVTAPVADLADSALTVHGAIGYTWEHDLHLFYKRAKLDRVLFGTPATWNERIAAAVLDTAPSES